MPLTLNTNNTNITIGSYERKKLRLVSRMATNRSRMEDQYTIKLHDILGIYGVRMIDVTRTIIGSVVPPVTAYITRAIRKLTKIGPVVIGEKTVTGLDVRLSPPEALGTDLVTGCVATVGLYGDPCVTQDMGMATTISVIDSNGSMPSGCIIPNVGISMEALTSHTAQLPAISIEAPDKVVGTNTVDCIRSGLIYGQASVVNGMCDRTKEGFRVKCKVIATGGLPYDIISYCRHEIIYSRNLLLEGLQMLYERNLPAQIFDVDYSSCYTKMKFYRVPRCLPIWIRIKHTGYCTHKRMQPGRSLRLPGHFFYDEQKGVVAKIQWVSLLVIELFEVVWAVGLRISESFSKLIPSVVTIVGLIASMYLLSLSLEELPIGIAYAIWTGIGTAGTLVFSIFWFREAITLS